MEAPAEAAEILSRRASPTYFEKDIKQPKGCTSPGPDVVAAYTTASDYPSRSPSVTHDEEKHSLLRKDKNGAAPEAPRLLRSSEVPVWYAANAHILTGYRPLTPSVRFCLTSLGSLHNETVNIYSHLIPCALALTGNYVLYEYFSARLPNALLADRLVFHIFLTGSVICFGVSAAYHALLCHSKQFHDLWLRLDYVAIIVQILGSFVSGIYMGFYCEPGPRAFHWGMIGTLSTITCFVMLHPRFQSQEYRLFRLWTFVITGLSGFAPVIHAMTMFPHEQLTKHMGVHYYYLEGVFILTGALIYGIHFPEKWSPVKFDIFGASHQIFHICVVLGAVSHFWGILSAFEYTYNNPRCF